VTTTGVPAAGQVFASADVRLLAWDGFAKRWTSVFDAATQTGFTSFDAGVPMRPQTLASPSETTPLLPHDRQVDVVRVAELRDRPVGADLLLWATEEFGDGSGLLVAIVSYEHQVAHVAWSFGAGYGGTVSVIGIAPSQQVQVSNQWETTTDAHCCPVRPYQFVIARQIQDNFPTYTEVSDDRSWLGAFLLTPTSGGKTYVVGTVPGSPAATVLQPLDVLNRAVGATPPSTATLGPAVVDEVAAHHPSEAVQLDIERGGRPLVVGPITLGSHADAAARRTSFPQAGYLGVSSTTMTPDLSRQYNLPNVSGAVVSQVQSGGPADKAGVGQNAVITGLDNYVITDTDLLLAVVAMLKPDTTVPLSYVDSSGNQRRVSITMGFPSANAASTEAVML
jgi:hypothetical protein